MIEENETYHGSCLSNAVKCSSSVTKINATSFKQSTMNIVEHSPFAKKPRHITIKDDSDSSVTPFHKKENKGRNKRCAYIVPAAHNQTVEWTIRNQFWTFAFSDACEYRSI